MLGLRDHISRPAPSDPCKPRNQWPPLLSMPLFSSHALTHPPMLTPRARCPFLGSPLLNWKRRVKTQDTDDLPPLRPRTGIHPGSTAAPHRTGATIASPRPAGRLPPEHDQSHPPAPATASRDPVQRAVVSLRAKTTKEETIECVFGLHKFRGRMVTRVGR
ncbi:hypothetical protein U9M48_007141 [Paspalum notatum var. saurae]|uniref:Uncharacterized protein n=1 Tax=Paspalum notatum var. saurae TaxID=547442 RepID=A0AAQ3PTQ3_PASNO